MKKITSLKFAVAVMAIACFTMVLKSCKKVENNTATPEATNAAQKALVKAIKAQYGNVSSGVIFNIDKIADSLSYRDIKSNAMMKAFAKSSDANNQAGGGGTSRVCFYNCSNTTDPNNLRIFYTLQSIQRKTYCRTNSFGWLNDISIKWQVSLPFTPLLADPNNAANLSSGALVIKPPVGPWFGSAGITPIVISDLGTDPTCNANKLYDISYTYSYVTQDNVFTNGYDIDASLNLYNNCSLVGNLVNSGYVSSNLANKMAPCDRTDHVWLAGGGTNNCIIAAGNYITGCSVPSGLIATDLHQIEYRQVDNTNGNYKGWTAQTSTINYGEIPFTGTFTATMSASSGFLYLLQMTPGSGVWLVRYRNIKSPSCNFIGTPSQQNIPPAPPGNTWTGNWVTEIISL